MKERLGLSFHNTRALHQLVDPIPDRAGKWVTKTLTFQDRPEEKFIVRHRDPVQAIQSLLGDPALAKDIVYAPKKVFSGPDKANCIYSEMWTGQWWNSVQVFTISLLLCLHVILQSAQKKLPLGATVAPVIIATDKTQLTQFSGSKQAYSVYLTLGNIPRAIQRKPSKQACILIAYLSVDKISRVRLTEQEHRNRGQRLFHDSMRMVLSPLIEAGTHGVEMTSGNGTVRRVYPLLTCYVADFPQQCLVTCSKGGTCPKCRTGAKNLGDPNPTMDRSQKWTLGVINSSKANSSSPSQFFTQCMAQDVAGGVPSPFWRGFPLTDIHRTITSDVLHQLYQLCLRSLELSANTWQRFCWDVSLDA